MPVMWCLAYPKIGERQAPPVESSHLADAMGLRLLRPDHEDETYRNGNLGGVWQWIESVNQTVTGQLDLERHRARTPAGVFPRIAGRLLATAAGIWHNPPSASR